MSREWQFAELDNPAGMGPELYRVYRQHRLLPNDPAIALAMLRALTNDSRIWSLSCNGDTAGMVIMSGIYRGDQAYIDVVLVPSASGISRGMASGELDEIREMFMPTLVEAFDALSLRRLTSYVPIARSKTKRVLMALGFKVEGRMRQAFRAVNEEPQDVLVMGYVKGD